MVLRHRYASGCNWTARRCGSGAGVELEVKTFLHGLETSMTKGKQRFVIKRTAHGLGLITLEPIAAGKRIIEYTGPLISNEEVDKRPDGKYFFGVNSKWSVDGT